MLLLGHHDTVWPTGTLAVHPCDVVDGVLRGPGCFDMKAGLVMAFHAVATLADRDGVTILVTGDEEIGSPTSRALIESEATGAVAALVLEASADGGALKTARKGTSLYEIEVVGRAAHAGLEPEKGVNATLELAHQVHAVAALADEAAGTTVTPTVTSAGTTSQHGARGGALRGRRTSLVAGRARAGRRRACGHSRPCFPARSVVVHGGINRPPLEESSSRHLFERASALASRLGMPPVRGAAVGGASDGNFTAGVGVATLDGLGAVGGGAHAADEHVLVDRLLDRTALLGCPAWPTC